MPILTNETARIEEFKQLMDEIDLTYNRDYRLADTGEVFQIDFIAGTTAKQYEQAAEILATTLNEDI